MESRLWGRPIGKAKFSTRLHRLLFLNYQHHHGIIEGSDGLTGPYSMYQVNIILLAYIQSVLVATYFPIFFEVKVLI